MIQIFCKRCKRRKRLQFSDPAAFSTDYPMNRHEKQEGFAGQRLVVLPRPILATALQQPLLKHLLPTDAGYYPKAGNHICTREKGCPEVIFIYCAEGDGWCEIAGSRHEIGKNQLLVINARIPHIYGASEKKPWTIHWFHAAGANVPFYLERLGVTDQRPVVSLGGDVQLFSLF
jgi:AraC family transcriptional regulator of arabinose operon